MALAEEHDLGVQGDRLRLERGGGGQAERLPDRLDPDRLRAQGSLELVPRERLLEQPPGVHDQVAAVRPVQRPRLDQREVGDQVAELGHVLDAAHEVGVGRVVLVDDRGALLRGAGDEHVDLVASSRPLLGPSAEEGLHRARPLGRRQEVLGVVDDVLLDVGEVLEHGGHVRPAGPHLVDQVRGGGGGDQPVQPARLVAVAPRLPRERPQGVLELLLDRHHLRLEPLLLAGGQLLERLGLDHLAVAQGRHPHPGRRLDDGDAPRAGLLLEAVEGLLALRGELLLEELLPRPVVVAVEEGGDGGTQLLDEVQQVLAQERGASRRQAQRAGPARVGELVDVSPVGGRLLRGGAPLEERAHEAVLAHARGAEGVEVVAVAADAYREADRLLRALLPDDAGHVGEVGGRAEGEGGGVRPAAEGAGGQGGKISHGRLRTCVFYELTPERVRVDL